MMAMGKKDGWGGGGEAGEGAGSSGEEDGKGRY